MGWIMVGGVIAAMTFSLLFAPLFYVLVRQVTTRLRGQRPATSGDQA
jgi:hypothetical protein